MSLPSHCRSRVQCVVAVRELFRSASHLRETTLVKRYRRAFDWNPAGERKNDECTLAALFRRRFRRHVESMPMI